MGLPANPPVVVVNGTDPGDHGRRRGRRGRPRLRVVRRCRQGRHRQVRRLRVDHEHRRRRPLGAVHRRQQPRTDVMSTSFGQCESSMGSTENSFYNSLWSQAASQGITSFVSTGDSGAAGCNGGSDTEAARAARRSPASPPRRTTWPSAAPSSTIATASARTGTRPTRPATSSAKSYIPEVAWNESGAATTCPSGDTCSGLWSSSGGVVHHLHQAFLAGVHGRTHRKPPLHPRRGRSPRPATTATSSRRRAPYT
jgi:hypothetical protein